MVGMLIVFIIATCFCGLWVKCDEIGNRPTDDNPEDNA